MFDIHDFTHPGDLVCTKAPSVTLDHRDFDFFDAKGFRLNAAEQHFYRANDYHIDADFCNCLLYTSPSPRDGLLSRMPSSA